MSNGLSICPGTYEDEIKLCGAPIISNAVVVGDNQVFISCLITLKVY